MNKIRKIIKLIGLLYCDPPCVTLETVLDWDLGGCDSDPSECPHYERCEKEYAKECLERLNKESARRGKRKKLREGFFEDESYDG